MRVCQLGDHEEVILDECLLNDIEPFFLAEQFHERHTTLAKTFEHACDLGSYTFTFRAEGTMNIASSTAASQPKKYEEEIVYRNAMPMLLGTSLAGVPGHIKKAKPCL